MNDLDLKRSGGKINSTGHLAIKFAGKLLTGLTFLTACIAGTTQSGFAQTKAGSGSSGMMIHIDPKTGAVKSESAPGTVPLKLSPADQNAASTSHEGLVEVPNPNGNGFRLDLQGRFQSPLVATIDAGGNMKTHHLGDLPAKK